MYRTYKKHLCIPLILICALLPTINANAQNDDANESVFIIVEEMPRFQHSKDRKTNNKLVQKYFEECTDSYQTTDKGKVVVKFVVNELGNAEGTEIMESLSAETDSLVFRCVEKMPRWEPGYQRKKAVKVQFTYPVYFK